MRKTRISQATPPEVVEAFAHSTPPSVALRTDAGTFREGCAPKGERGMMNMNYEVEVVEREARLLAKDRGVRQSMSAKVCVGALLGVPLKGDPEQVTDIAAGAWIGPNAVVMAGCDIGENAVVMPGSVVLTPVPPHAVVQGNPAQIVDYACECGQPLGIEACAAWVEAPEGCLLRVVHDATLTCKRCGAEWDAKELVGDG